MDHKNVYAALLAAQRDMGPLVKDATNPHFRNKYASLEAVIDTIEDPLHANGLLYLQRLDLLADGSPILRTEIVHAATGEKVESVAPLVCKDPDNPQALGGAITYLRRYSLLALVGIAPEDDDGNAATQAPKAAFRPASIRGNTGHPVPAAAEEDEPQITSWTEAHKVLRSKRITTAEEFAVLTGHDIKTGLTPQQAVDLALSCLADIEAATGD
jgi:hypothetical protein